MADSRLENITFSQQVKQEASDEKDKALKDFRHVLWACLGVIAILFIVFLWRQVFFKWDLPVDNNLLGTLGDFIGGVIGTLVTLYSVFLLVQTLRKQIESNADTMITNNSVIATNQSVVETNQIMIELDKLQLFENQFQVFLSQYKDAIATYESRSGKKGRAALEEMVSSSDELSASEGLIYTIRTQAAVRIFEEFYAENRQVCSVHLRSLYLLARYVAESEKDFADLSWYAKCVRGQLSDGELVLLRYNCMASFGIAMRRFVNHFNLLKHLPLMSLIEFRRWASLLPDKHERSALDATFITLKKWMKEENSSHTFDGNNDAEKLNTKNVVETRMMRISENYLVSITFLDGHCCMIFRLEEDKKSKIKGSTSLKWSYTEVALDRLGTAELPELFYSFLQEVFLVGNFRLFGNPSDCVHEPIPVEDSNDSFIFEIEVKGPRRLVLAENQMYPTKQ